MHAGQVLTGEAAAHRSVGAHAQKNRVVLREQLLEGQVGAHLDAQAKLDAHALHDLAALLDHLLLELEGRDAERQQAPDTLVDDRTRSA
mgnify:CR=1 FL=1